jgi:hypothetical protein
MDSILAPPRGKNAPQKIQKQDRDEVEQETVARVAATSAKKTHAERNVMCPREDTERERERERETWQPTSQRYDSCLNAD